MITYREGVLVRCFFGKHRGGAGIVLAVFLVISSGAFSAQDVLVAADKSVSVTAREFEHVVENSPSTIRSAVQSSDEDRFEIAASILLDKKIRGRLEAIDPAITPELFYRYHAAMRAAAKEFDAARFQVQLVLPDLEPLALEHYRVAKNEVAIVPESRIASHILLLCSEDCDQEARRAELLVIRDKALEGVPFADLAAEHSQDPGSRQRGGRLSQPITKKDERIDATFRDTAFALSATGEISEIVVSRFGLHIIRLDQVVAERVYSFEEIKAPLIERVENRFREDAYREYILSMGPSKDFMIDYEAIDEVLGPVQSASP
jgi:parvulin-like peptidyl-prolyl isomerase